jgi:hypothetical protein
MIKKKVIHDINIKKHNKYNNLEDIILSIIAGIMFFIIFYLFCILTQGF